MQKRRSILPADLYQLFLEKEVGQAAKSDAEVQTNIILTYYQSMLNAVQQLQPCSACQNHLQIEREKMPIELLQYQLEKYSLLPENLTHEAWKDLFRACITGLSPLAQLCPDCQYKLQHDIRYQFVCQVKKQRATPNV